MTGAQLRLILFSGLGSLPLHMSAVIAVSGVQHGFSATEAGALMSACLAGLFAATTCRAFNVRLGGFAPRLSVLGIIQAALLGIVPFWPPTVELPLWVAIGWVSGILMFEGMHAAATAQHRFVSFLVRLSFAMVLSATAALGGAALPLPLFEGVCLMYAALTLAVTLALMVGRSTPTLAAGSSATLLRRAFSVAVALALAPCVLFFCGTLMLVTHIVDLVAQGGALRASNLTALGWGKLLSSAVLGIVLVCLRGESRAKLVVSVVGVAAVLWLSQHAPVLPVAIFICAFEVGINVAGASFLGETARVGDAIIHRLMPMAALLGVALGPAIGAQVLEGGGPDRLAQAGVVIMCGATLLLLARNIHRRRRGAAA
ncbi:MAG: hypothetical protein AAF318_15155 [Pseudomonadota bacterium]